MSDGKGNDQFFAGFSIIGAMDDNQRLCRPHGLRKKTGEFSSA
jgi:hypothetical protein